jgi:hypothetical protein
VARDSVINLAACCDSAVDALAGGFVPTPAELAGRTDSGGVISRTGHYSERKKNMPLTTRGIAAQILSSVQALKRHHQFCSTNDCKVVVNHLVRKYSEPLAREGNQRHLRSRLVGNGETDDTVEDHAIPVIVLVEKLLSLRDDQVVVSEANLQHIERQLSESLLLVEITEGEDAILSAKGFQRRMPDGWGDSAHPYYRDPLARYKAAGIELDI